MCAASSASSEGQAVAVTAGSATAASAVSAAAPAATPAPAPAAVPPPVPAKGPAHGRPGVRPQFDQLTMDQPTVRRLVLGLAGPSIIDNLLVTLVQMADMIMVSRLGADATAAVGLSNQPMFFAMAAFMALNVGSTALVARMIGARDIEGANRAARQSMVLSAALGLVVGMTGAVFAPQILRFMGAQPDAMARGIPYLRIVLGGMAFNAVSMNLSSVMRGAGDTKTPMKVHIVSNLTNVTLNYALIYGHFGLPRLEVAGAGWATLTSRIVAAVLTVLVLASGKFVITLHRGQDYRPTMDIMRRIARVGFPAAAEQFVMRGGQMLFVRIVASLGTVTYAAHQIAINVESLTFMPGMGFGTAATSLVGQGLGAGHPEWSERLGRAAQRYAMNIACCTGTLFFLAGRQIATLYTNVPEVVDATAMCLRLVAIAQPFMVTNFTMAGALRGAGDTRWTLYSSFIGIWGVRLVLAYLLTLKLGMGLLGAWIAMVADMVTRAIVVYARFSTGKWKKIRV